MIWGVYQRPYPDWLPTTRADEIDLSDQMGERDFKIMNFLDDCSALKYTLLKATARFTLRVIHLLKIHLLSIRLLASRGGKGYRWGRLSERTFHVHIAPTVPYLHLP